MNFIRAILQPAYELLSPQFRKQSIWVALLMVGQALLDFFNMGVFVPLILLITKPGFADTRTWIPSIFSSYSDSTLILVFTGFIFLFTVVKYWMIQQITRYKSRFAYEVAHDISKRVLDQQLSMGYELFTKSDYSREVNRVANSPLILAHDIIISIATLIAEGLVALLILVGVLIVNIKLMLSLLLVMVPIGLLYRMSRKELKSINKELEEKIPLLIKFTLRIFEGWIDIKTNQKDHYFKKEFERAHSELMKVHEKEDYLQAMTVRITELCAAAIICFIIGWMILFGSRQSDIIYILTIYVGASFRLMPSFNRVLNSLIHIHTHSYLLKDFKFTEANESALQETGAPISFNDNIKIENISFAYSDRTILFNKLSLEIKKGEKIAIVGESGSGKTSLLHILLGMLRPDSGSFQVDHKIIKSDLPDYQKLFGYVSQKPYILETTIAENIAFGCRQDEINSNGVWEALKKADLADFVNQLPEKENTKIHEQGVTLSGGQKQRLALARALYQNREIFLFDEVTNQLDEVTESRIVASLQAIASQKNTLIMVTHHKQSLPLFDRVFELKSGRLLELSSEFSSSDISHR